MNIFAVDKILFPFPKYTEVNILKCMSAFIIVIIQRYAVSDIG